MMIEIPDNKLLKIMKGTQAMCNIESRGDILINVEDN